MRIVILLFFSFFASILPLKAQGIYTEFGQNRIQYQQFKWKTLSHENIEVLYYGEEDILASKAMQTAIQELSRLENYLSYKYGGTMQIMVFSNLNDYRQSNVGYTNPQMNSGGYLLIPNDVNTVYFNGDYNYLTKQLTRAVCEILLREMIYGGSLQDRFERVRSAALPVWFTAGLSQFLAESWNAETETRFRDAMDNHGFRNFNLLTAEENTLAGVGIWRYLVEKYGAESVSTIVFIARYTHSAESAIYFHTKKTMNEFLAEWRSFYQAEIHTDLSQQLPKGKSNVPDKISGKRNTDFALSPDGTRVAIVTNDNGRFDIWVYNLQKGNIKHIYSGGLKVLNQLPDYQFPKIAWNKEGQLHALIFETGLYRLLKFNNGSHTDLKIDFSAFSGLNDFSFFPDNANILFSAVKAGKCDIYVYNKITGKFETLTSDFYFDHDAIATEDGSVLFVSNRQLEGDTVQNFASGIYNLFRYTNGIIIPLTHYTQNVNVSDPISYSASVTGYVCDINGLNNAWVVHADSGFQTFAQTNYSRGLEGQNLALNRKITAEMILLNGKYIIFTGEVPDNPVSESVNVKTLPWKVKIQDLDSIFSIRNLHTINEPGVDDSTRRTFIDSINKNYTFQTGFPKKDYQSYTPADSVVSDQHFKKVNFLNSLQPEFLLSQVDNRVLGTYAYSNRIKHETLRNPWLMPFVKVSLSDLLKNYVIEAGVRTSLDFYNTDYITRFSLLKYRFDHDIQLSRHSRKYEDRANKLMQNLSILGSYTLSYPITENARFALSGGGRRELLSAKVSEKNVLNIPDKNDYFITGKFEFIYDNTTALGLNRVNGYRLKTGLDFARRLNNTAINVTNLFIDARWYLPVKRGMVWANKLTGLYSLSAGKIANYLGAVENWTSKTQFPKDPIFLNGDQYVFQQWVGNMRGFYRGVRMGSNFALLNSEFRVPIFAMIRKKPLESEFMRNFTLIALCDVGTAFNGKSPADPQNPFNTVYLSTPNYSLSITSQRNPWVVGLGYGVRTRVLGYFIKYDHARGYLEKQWNSPMNYLSLGFDF